MRPLSRQVAGAGCRAPGAVSWLCTWWRQVGGAGAGCRCWCWCCELDLDVVAAGAGAGAGAGAASWPCTWWRQGAGCPCWRVVVGCWVPGGGAGRRVP